MKKLGITIILAAALSSNSAAALPIRQDIDKSMTPELKSFNPDLGISIEGGTTGLGIGLESQLNDLFQVRTSFTWMPHFEFPMHFNIQVGDGKPDYDDQGRSRFDRMAGYLEEMTGFKIDQQVDMIGVPHFYNFKLLVDVFPFKDKRWYFTAGFYAGPSVIGKAYNRTEDMTTLMSVAMYNNIYFKVDDMENNPDSQIDGVFLGLKLPPQVKNRILEAGRMGMRVGDFKDGSPYMMEPDQDNMVKAEMKVNAFRPYIGTGYKGLIDRNNDRLKFSFDCGVMFWGGAPKVYAQPGTDQETEIMGLDNIIGQVGRYTDVAKRFKVFPLLNLSISYTLFK